MSIVLLPAHEPVPAGDYDHALHIDDPNAPSLLEPYLKKDPPNPPPVKHT